MEPTVWEWGEEREDTNQIIIQNIWLETGKKKSLKEMYRKLQEII